ncbi:Uncharacterized protein APZ42_002239 [Daphnia magna]|uniref:Response regulatory domain-containing protein n=1 Tax=Daphnia magna TaxID=35525 RepID=A0A164IEP8_9CRUS|nr:Uncharacterized protein APZ42_002239 [Daphnia magna]
MDAMIEHVALSNKIERTQARGTEETVSAFELMNVVMQEYRQPERFELHIQEGVTFRAAPHFLALIIENLVSNAVKYAAEGKIIIRIQDEPDHVTSFCISNRVAEDNHPDEKRLFERYYRHPSFQNSPGMGIGLSLVNSAAQKMGAQVSPLNHLHSDIKNGSRPLVLALVEDDRLLRQEIEVHLRAHGFEVHAANSASGLDDLNARIAFDLYLIDLNLPGENGLSLCRRVRQSRPDAGIVIMTARVALNDKIAGYKQGGADLYMTKPVAPDELVLVLQSLGGV